MDADSKAASTSGLRPFPKGVSGNPGGKNPEREALRRGMIGDCQEMIDIIKSLARGARSEKVQLEAATYYVDQVIGRALVAVSGEAGGPIKVSGDLFGTLTRLAEPPK